MTSDPVALRARRKKRAGDLLTEEEEIALRAYNAEAKRRHDARRRAKREAQN